MVDSIQRDSVSGKISRNSVTGKIQRSLPAVSFPCGQCANPDIPFIKVTLTGISGNGGGCETCGVDHKWTDTPAVPNLNNAYILANISACHWQLLGIGSATWTGYATSDGSCGEFQGSDIKTWQIDVYYKSLPARWVIEVLADASTPPLASFFSFIADPYTPTSNCVEVSNEPNDITSAISCLPHYGGTATVEEL